MKIKICGITNKEDAKRLSEVGIWAFGFRDKDIPRQISFNQVAEIIKKLPENILSVFGVAFTPVDKIVSIIKTTSPKVIQLQKGGTIQDIEKLRNGFPSLKIWKTISTFDEFEIEEILEFEKRVDAILLHSKQTNWDKAKTIANQLKKPYILAGELDLDNIKTAFKMFSPFAIDLIRGVETIPGKKDFKKVKKLVNIVNRQDENTK